MSKPVGTKNKRFKFEDKGEKLRKRDEKRTEIQALKDSGHGDLLPDPESRLTDHHLNPSPEQQKVIDAKRRHWLQFVWAIPFRIYYEITGELAPVPPNGVFAYNGWTKIGMTPWDYILTQSMAYQHPFPKREHNLAYAVLAEYYTSKGITGPGTKDVHPGGGDAYKELLPRADELIQKWTKQDDFMNLSFPDILKYCRLDKNLTQGQVADMIGWQHLAVSRWERGEYEPSAQAIHELAKELPLIKRWFRYHPEWVKAHGAVL